MKNKKSNIKKILIVFILGVHFVFLSNSNFHFSDKQKTSLYEPKKSSGYSESFIHVDGNWTTYAITNNTILNQTAWAAMAQGDVTITFYARNLAGNEASESVTVIKSIPSRLEPGVIAIIVIISIVGGVAVAYVIIRKRKAPK